MKKDIVLFKPKRHAYDKPTSKKFQPRCLIDREDFSQSKGYNFNDENAENFQPSFLSIFYELMYEKSALKDHFGVVNCMGLDEFYGRNFWPLLPSFFFKFTYENPAWRHVFNAEICIGQKNFQFMVCFENFQPSKERQQVLNWELIFLSKSEFLSHVSSTYLLDDSQDVFCRFFVETPQALRYDDMVDIVHGNQGGHLLECVDQPFERQVMRYGDLMWSKEGLSLSYFSPIQAWIEKSCESAYQPWHIFDTLVHDLMIIFSHNVIYFPTHIYLVMSISLVWFITKQKGNFML
jgi:hypothetical protein